MRPWLAALCVMSGAVQADEATRLDTLTVTAPQEGQTYPLAVTAIETEDTIGGSQRSLADWFLNVPGVFTQNQNNAAQGLRLSIRAYGARAAFGVRGIRVTLDDIPITLPDGQTELDGLEQDLLQSARVIRGPAASLFGNAAGGVVELSSRPVGATALQLAATVADDEFSRVRVEGSWDERFRLSAQTLQTRGPREHSDSDSDIFSLRWQPRIGQGQLWFQLDALDIQSQDPGALTLEQARNTPSAARDRNVSFNAGESIKQNRLTAQWRTQRGAWALRSSAYGLTRTFDNRLPFEDSGQVAFARDAAGLGISGSVPHEILQTPARFTLGFDLQWQADSRQRFDNRDGGTRGPQRLSQRESAESAGAYLRHAWQFQPNWELAGGLRGDRLRLQNRDRFLGDGDDSGERTLNDLSHDISLHYRAGSQGLFIRQASAYETPTLNELANPAGGGFNPDLASSSTRSAEIGWQWQPGQVSLEIVAFRMSSSDELLAFELPDQPGRSFYRNAGETRRRGLEMAAEAQLLTHWMLRGSYSRINAEFENGPLAGNRLPGVPRDQAHVAVGYQQPRWSMLLQTQATGEIYADDANALRVPGHAVMNLRAAWLPSPAWRIEAAIDNLMDHDIFDNVRLNAFGGRAFEPAAGRILRLNARYTMSGI